MPKAKGKPFEKGHTAGFKKGESGNPGGRPKGGTSFAAVLREFLEMDGPQVAAVAGKFAQEFKALQPGLELRQMIALKWIMSIMNEPTPGLLQQLVDRTDGPVPTKIDVNWREEAKRDGHDANEIFEQMVAAAEARMVREGGGGGLEGSEEADRA